MSTLVTIGLLGALMVGCVFLLVRNQWVYHARLAVMNNPQKNVIDCLADYKRLPSYYAMLRRFWVWRVSDFMTDAP